jgi:hypothetical protein
MSSTSDTTLHSSTYSSHKLHTSCQQLHHMLYMTSDNMSYLLVLVVLYNLSTLSSMILYRTHNLSGMVSMYLCHSGTRSSHKLHTEYLLYHHMSNMTSDNMLSLSIPVVLYILSTVSSMILYRTHNLSGNK